MNMRKRRKTSSIIDQGSYPYRSAIPQVLKDDILVACQEAIHDVFILLPRKGTGGKKQLAPLTQDGRGLPEHVNLNLT